MEEKVWTKPEIVVLDVNEGTEGKPNAFATDTELGEGS